VRIHGRGIRSGTIDVLPGNIEDPSGHLLIWENGKVAIRRYWRNTMGIHGPVFFAAARELQERLIHTVRLCLKSDVEVGAFLSGGIDSSTVVALMRMQEAQVKTFAVGYAGKVKGFNELRYARQVADHLHTDHHELILGPTSSIDLLPLSCGTTTNRTGNRPRSSSTSFVNSTRRHVKCRSAEQGATRSSSGIRGTRESASWNGGPGYRK